MKKVMLLFFSAVFCFVLACGAVGAAAEEALSPACKAAYLCDWRSGTAVYEKEADRHLPIASMCKIMTLLLCFEEADAGRLAWDECIPVSPEASGMGGSQVFLEAGGEYPAEALIESICIASANDSCVAMAERISGSEALFVNKMNERAKQLGMENTVFVNCTGLPAPGQYSCARDVAAMLSALLCHAKYYEFSKIRLDTIEHGGGRETQMTNTNKLVRGYVGCDGGKTGYTSEAGHCLAATAQRGHMRVVAVVIGAPDSDSRLQGVRNLFDYACANYTSRPVFEEGVLPDEYCPVTGGKKAEAAVRPAQAGYVFCARGDTDEIFFEAEYKKLRAPVRAGEAVGEAVIYKNNVEIDRIPLLSNEDIAKRGYLDALQEIASGWNW